MSIKEQFAREHREEAGLILKLYELRREETMRKARDPDKSRMSSGFIYISSKFSPDGIPESEFKQLSVLSADTLVLINAELPSGREPFRFGDLPGVEADPVPNS